MAQFSRITAIRMDNPRKGSNHTRGRMTEPEQPKGLPEPERPGISATHTGETPPPTQAPAPAPPESKLRLISRRLRWRAHWLAPNNIAPRDTENSFEQSSDKQSNEASRVDEGQELRAAALWGVELFGPNETDGLYESLKSLGWTAGQTAGEEGAIAWVQAQRAYGNGGFYNVGLVTRSTDKRWLVGNANHARLPDDVDYLMVFFHQVVPAITSVVVCFVLKGESTTRYERELNLDRRSLRQRGPRWRVTRWDPSHVKQLAVERVRANYRRVVHAWFAENLPGYFVRLDRPHRLPMAELLVTKTEDLFSDQSRSRFFDWKRIVANVSHYDIWTSKSVQGLKFTIQRGRWPREEGNLLTAGIALQSIPEDRLKLYGGGVHAVVSLSHDSMDGLMSYFGISALLAEAARDVKETREALNLRAASRKSLKTISRIQQFFAQNAGTPTVARELRDSSKRPGGYSHYCSEFMAPPWGKDEAERHFAEELRNTVNYSATALIEDESSTREHFEQLSTVLSIRESIKAQRRMELLTVLALLVATLSLLIPTMPESWLTKLKAVWVALAF
jgi:hypothetical protein